MPVNNNGLVNYGKKLVILGKKFQNKKTTLDDIVKSCFELGLMISFKVEPSIDDSVEIKTEFPQNGNK